MTALGWLAVAVLGGAGAVTRFLVDGAISRVADRDFPYGTFAINVSGALILGLLDGLGVTGLLLTELGTATIGSFTTFSTWMLETDRLREDGEAGATAANIVVSLLAGFAAAALGRLIGAQL